jgi:ParB/Sulfiredoxin domain
MKHQLSKISVADTAKALQDAEARLERPEVNGGETVYIQVKPRDIGERLELFQPRRPGWGTRTLETAYVNELATRITRKGEIDPVLVVKLKTGMTRRGYEWIVVDGHHRIAAYLKLNRKETIKCEWFAGSAREATDESLRRNEKIHLRADQGDKAEEAWKRTLLGWGSKAEVVSLTGCGEGTVAKMRRTALCHQRHTAGAERTPQGEKLHKAFPRGLKYHKWSEVNRVLLDLSPQDWNSDDAAAKLSRQLVTRMTNTLSRNPEVTAHALWLYDRDLCPELVEALKKRMESGRKTESELEAQAAYEPEGGD